FEEKNGRRKDTELRLASFLGLHENMNKLPAGLTSMTIQALAQAYLDQGRALVVLDGLDEVANPDQRKKVMQEVKKFLQNQVPESDDSPDRWNGNRLLLTSRIIGYQFDPLTDLK